MRRASVGCLRRASRCWSGPAARRMDAGAPMPQRLNRPVALDRPDQTLFNEAVLIYSNEVRREHGRAPLPADPGLSRAAVDHAPQHGAAPDPQPRAAGARAARPVAADEPAVAAVSPGGGEHRDGQGLSAARPADLDRSTRAAASSMATPRRRCRCIPTPAWPRRWSPLAGLAEAPRLAALDALPAARARASASTRRGRPAATSTWCRTSRTERSAAISRRRPGSGRDRRCGGRSSWCGSCGATSRVGSTRVWK